MLLEWLRLCASNPEFVDNYNRLRGTNVSFAIPKRSGLEIAIDAATGHVPHPQNDEQEVSDFMEFCADLLTRIRPLPVKEASNA